MLVGFKKQFFSHNDPGLKRKKKYCRVLQKYFDKPEGRARAVDKSEYFDSDQFLNIGAFAR